MNNYPLIIVNLKVNINFKRKKDKKKKDDKKKDYNNVDEIEEQVFIYSLFKLSPI